jgi:hypothetical protein
MPEAAAVTSEESSNLGEALNNATSTQFLTSGVGAAKDLAKGKGQILLDRAGDAKGFGNGAGQKLGKHAGIGVTFMLSHFKTLAKLARYINVIRIRQAASLKVGCVRGGPWGLFILRQSEFLASVSPVAT